MNLPYLKRNCKSFNDNLDGFFQPAAEVFWRHWEIPILLQNCHWKIKAFSWNKLVHSLTDFKAMCFLSNVKQFVFLRLLGGGKQFSPRVDKPLSQETQVNRNADFVKVWCLQSQIGHVTHLFYDIHVNKAFETEGQKLKVIPSPGESSLQKALIPCRNRAL